jgi:sarcosine oxidase subunit gamma
VDVSANRAVLDLTGPGVREFLSKGCSLDLHPDHWGDGACAQTMLAKAPVILQQRKAGTRMFVRPSFADYLVEWFMAAARG